MIQMPRPSYQHIVNNRNSFFTARIDKGANLFTGMHYHPEIELILIRKCCGTRVVGNSAERFGDNDLLLIGKNTPHGFLHDTQIPTTDNIEPEALVVQFSESFLGDDFLRLPELKEIYDLLLKARNGLQITERSKDDIIPLLVQLFKVPSLDGIILLLEILKRLSFSQSHRMLATNKFDSFTSGINDQRFKGILEYTYAHFDEHITIEQMAVMTHLTRESFCRYFKAHTNKTYIEFLTEYRINKACQMIREGRQTIKETGYACGFDSLSNFYCQFKKFTGLSPLEFKRENSDADIKSPMHKEKRLLQLCPNGIL